MNVAHATVLRWTNELGAMCLNTQQTNHILNPKQKGIFSLDGKTIRVGGKKMAYLIATDVKTLDIAHWGLTSVEDELGCRKFLINLRLILRSIDKRLKQMGMERNGLAK